MDRIPAKLWNDMCCLHGVGTDYFKSLKNKPFGYAGEAKTSRTNWLKYKRRIGDIDDNYSDVAV